MDKQELTLKTAKDLRKLTDNYYYTEKFDEYVKIALEYTLEEAEWEARHGGSIKRVGVPSTITGSEYFEEHFSRKSSKMRQKISKAVLNKLLALGFKKYDHPNNNTYDWITW